MADVKYTINKLPIEDAWNMVSDFEYVLLRMMSEKTILKKASDVMDIAKEECLEARFFSKNKELHIYEGEDDYEAKLIVDEADIDSACIFREYKLADHYRELGKKLVVKLYLQCDEDGQSNIVLTRPCDVI